MRRAGRGDLAGVARLLAQLAPAWTAEQALPPVTKHDEEVWAAIVADERRVVLVAEYGGVVVGVVDLVVVTALVDGAVPHGLLDSMVVDAAHRGQGVGQALIGAVRCAARDAGCCRLELLSSKERGQAHAFYQAAGFARVADGFRADL